MNVFIIIIQAKRKHVLRLSTLPPVRGPTNDAQTVVIQFGPTFPRFDSILNLVISVALDRNLNDYLSKKMSERALKQIEVKPTLF